MSKGSREGLTRLWPIYGIELQDSPLDFDSIQKVDGIAPPKDVILEVGFGMGHATAAMAQADQSNLILAVDVHSAGISALMRICEREAITNVRVIQGDAVKVIEQMIPSNSLAGFRLYFPDPWPKARHQKRRFVRPDLVELVTTRLKSGATFHAATDWQDYANQMLKVLEAAPGLENAYEGFAPRPDWRPMTAFERRGLKRGHNISDLIFIKK